MTFYEKEMLLEIASQVKKLQEKGNKEDTLTFIDFSIINAENSKCSNGLINRLYLLKDYVDSDKKL